MLTDAQRKLLTEQLLKEPWYEQGTANKNRSFTTPNDFFAVWTAMQKREDYEDFWDWVYEKYSNLYKEETKCLTHPEGFDLKQGLFWQYYIVGAWRHTEAIINVERFPILCAEWLEGKGE